MKLFLDTSSLFKLYHREDGTDELEDLFSQIKIAGIYLSEIAKIEFNSTIWKKVRTKEITIEQAEITLQLFEIDFARYNFIATNSLVVEQARNLTTKYGVHGLRTLDSIQLSTCITLKDEADIFCTADKLLKTLMEREGLQTDMPNL
jgi:uncharacterized protein